MKAVIADTWLLLALRWQIGWNSFKGRKTSTQVFSVLGGFVLFLFFASVSAGAGLLAGALLRRFPNAELEPVIPSLILTGVALFLLIGSFGTALGSLFLSSDLDLLMTAPVDRKAVFVSKILNGMVWNYMLVFALAVPALITYGLGLGYGPAYYVLALITLLGTPLLPAALGAILVLLVARFAPARRVREVLGLMGALFGISCALIGQTSRFWLRSFTETGSTGTEQFLEGLRGIIAWPIPPFMAGRGLEAAGRGDIVGALANLSVFLLLTFGVFALCVWAADFLYATGWVRMQSSGSARRSKQRADKAARERGWLSRVPADVAIAIKDWKVVPRDLRNFAQMLAPLIIWPILYLNFTSGGGRRGRGIPSADFFSNLDGVMVAVGVLISTVGLMSNIAFTSISREGKSWWLLKIAPVSAFELLRGKFLAAAVPYAVLSTLLMLGAAVWRQLDPLWSLYGWLGVEVLGLGMLAVAVALSVPWAKLDWDDPRKMTSGWGSFAAFAIWFGMGLLGGLFLALPVFFEALDPLLAPLLALLGLICAAGMSAGVAYLAYKYGERKLPEIG
ncbi:MAG TPA: hypothetical protein VND68_01215 [Chloroflexia bacterium]|nr:hypothetical protein [Chloroflexia bacterium]